MLYSVSETAVLSGVSVRTLHYYDKIGLLKPASVSEAGYRSYDDDCLRRLQEILLFKELEFPLQEILRIMNHPNHNRQQVIREQLRLLEQKQARLASIVAFARNLCENGASNMDFSLFNEAKQKEYAEKAKTQWGDTPQYQEYAKKAKNYDRSKQMELASALMLIFTEIGKHLGEQPDSPALQTLIADLQRYITEHYYHCDCRTLRGLGQFYAAGGEMTDNIDAAGGSGTARLAAAAIEIYCSRSESSVSFS